ncbi:MAG: hypothetical protein R3B82_05155 [Sandaracinaceae bacterium]
MREEKEVKARRLSVLTAFAARRLALAGPLAPAGRARQRLRCQIHVTQAAIRGTSQVLGLIAAAATAQRLRGLTGEPRRARWHGAVFASPAPPGDRQFHALFYDRDRLPELHPRDERSSRADRTQRTVLHRINLPRPTFRPNKRIEMVVTVHRQEVGSTRFIVDGEEIPPQRPGRLHRRASPRALSPEGAQQPRISVRSAGSPSPEGKIAKRLSTTSKSRARSGSGISSEVAAI